LLARVERKQIRSLFPVEFGLERAVQALNRRDGAEFDVWSQDCKIVLNAMKDAAVMHKRILAVMMIAGLCGAHAPSYGAERTPVRSSPGPRVIWKNPGDVASRDLYYGSGGRERRPRGGFTFVSEDSGGTTPKLVVRDQAGVTWRVKLGPEAKAETAATRLMWAAGYYTDDDYVVRQFRVKGMPQLRRGQKFVNKAGIVEYGRFERSHRDARYAGHWDWKENPFVGTRELNGLKVMMALLNNWDLKDSNTTIYALGSPASPTLVYLVGDVGASFGKPNYMIPSGKSKPAVYAKSKFVTDVERKTVDFNAPGTAPLLSPFFLPHMIDTAMRTGQRDLTRDIPRSHARWIGSILSRLSDRQLRAAFEGAGYDVSEVKTLTAATRSRIQMLQRL
jgi:hypothetical protein